ncbi:peptide chain release factor 3 [Glycomyces algeriensis]|jgi:peptide chain release factor 3|uniref:Peptide chain release factor 3 n=1 Tax=Glycomyces algeriensis TaxID=256037 RepID=A0A9W6G5V0_9ACTN|nr:peptide chain release factor 3 [Glycomyces algeriensis]MDA1368412.1 peptide chain release factor 3 [Glycomyces algeriensis]MDR7353218.1 peptide chain release factor 3 [Glycomyces algeriensis]GLI40912.1 peptide chain release factor 3 [Glycomyces algeriensis]
MSSHIAAEAARRRTFAVISHPDAGKSTITEALALYGRAISSAGAVHGKGDRKGVVSDWMSMEQDRGISITSAALQFEYRDCVVNLLDTPGHADFSEDTYRVLTAVDAAVMLLDAAKGLEPQTLKLFEVCRARRIPVITFINKWDRPAKDALELIEEIETRIGIKPTPVTWPVGVGGEFRGVIERVGFGEESGGRRATGPQVPGMVRYERSPGGQQLATAEFLDEAAAMAQFGPDYERAQEESELLSEVEADFDPKTFESGQTTPTLFGAALVHFGVGQLLDLLVDIAPSPFSREDAKGSPRDLEDGFSGFVFKSQANMNASHRDQLAFIRVCSGHFERGMQVTQAQGKRTMSTKYAQTLFGSARDTVDEAWPGDIVGLVNATGLSVGDTIYAGKAVEYPPLPAFAPEHFGALQMHDTSKAKRFRRGIAQLDAEGVVQVLYSERRGEATPVLAAVGPLQFEVTVARLQAEFDVPATINNLPFKLARLTDAEGAQRLRTAPGVEVFTRPRDGAHLVALPNKYRIQTIVNDYPGLVLEPLLAGGQG